MDDGGFVVGVGILIMSEMSESQQITKEYAEYVIDGPGDFFM